MTHNVLQMKVFIKTLKKGSQFKFNNTIYTVKQKFSDWKKNDEPYLVTTCGEVFWFDELKVGLVAIAANGLRLTEVGNYEAQNLN